MKCTSPLLGVPIGTTKNGKIKYSIHKLSENNFNECLSTTLLSHEYDRKNAVILPCGKCLACRLNYARMWSNRCMLELPYHESNYFVTLTFNDEYIQRFRKDFQIEHTYVEDGVTHTILEDSFMYSLDKKEFQLFMKRLRKRTGQKLMYYMCGEYGSSSSKRPHFHAIIFGLTLDNYKTKDPHTGEDIIVPDLEFYKMSDQGDPMYTSHTLNDCWTYETEEGIKSKGYIVVGSVTAQSCSYVARYTSKKVNNQYLDYFYMANGIQKEYTSMSLKPAIGRNWFEDHAAELETSTYVIGENGQHIYFPRLYKRYLESGSEGFYALAQEIKQEQYASVVDSNYASSLATSQSYVDQLKSEDITLNAKASVLKRRNL